jgi:hypothetical protein
LLWYIRILILRKSVCRLGKMEGFWGLAFSQEIYLYFQK